MQLRAHGHRARDLRALSSLDPTALDHGETEARGDFALLVATIAFVANPVAHVVRAVDEVPYAAWHPLNVGLAAALVVVAIGWGRALARRGWPPGVREPMRRVAPLLAIGGFAVASAPWSMAPLRSAGWGAHLALMTVAACVLVQWFGVATLRRAALWAVLIVLAASVLMALLVPAYGLVDDPLYRGAWRGLFAGKNHLGLVAALAMLLAATTAASTWLRASGVLLGAVVLVGARSGTGLLTALTGLAVALLAPRAARLTLAARRRWVLGGLALTLAGATVLVLGWRDITTALGRDPTLTGRTVLWSHVLERVAARPWTGYGMRAYFECGQDETELQRRMNRATGAVRVAAPPRVVRRRGTGAAGGAAAAGASMFVTLPEPTWKISTAHNGLLHVALDLGVPATLLLLVGLVLGAAPAARRFMGGASDLDDTAWLALLASLVAHNLGEVSLLRSWHPEALLWTLVVVHWAASPARAATQEA